MQRKLKRDLEKLKGEFDSWFLRAFEAILDLKISVYFQKRPKEAGCIL
jgi:hypothetical protein